MSPFIFQKNKAGLRATESDGLANSERGSHRQALVHLRPDALADPALCLLHLLPCGSGLTRPLPWALLLPSHPSASVRRIGSVVSGPQSAYGEGGGAAQLRGTAGDRRRQRCWGGRMTAARGAGTVRENPERWNGTSMA